jgi:hypothetical protein
MVRHTLKGEKPRTVKLTSTDKSYKKTGIDEKSYPIVPGSITQVT